MFRFNFDAQAGETPATIAQKRALVAQIMGSQRAPQTFGEGLSALGDGIVANVLGGRAEDAERKGRAAASPLEDQFRAMMTGQQAPTPPAQYGASASAPPSTASAAAEAMAGGDFMSGLIQSESGGNWNALNSEGYGGRLQFGKERLADAARAGVIPAGVTGADFSRMSPEQQQAVENWHFADIDRQAEAMGLTRYYGTTIAGVPINANSVRAMAHLGGIGGAQKFIQSGGSYNPADSNGTSLSNYGTRFGGGSAPGAQAPMQPQPSQMDPAFLMQIISQPFIDESVKAMAQEELGRIRQQQDPAYQMQLAAAQQSLAQGGLDYQRSALELEQMRNPAAPAPIQVNGQLVDPRTGLVIGDYRDAPSAPEPINVGGVLLDPRTYEPIFDSRSQSDTGFTLSPGQERFDAAGNSIANVPEVTGAPEYGFMTLPDGTLVRTDASNGAIQPMGSFAAPQTAPEAPTSVREYDAYAQDEIAAGRPPLSRLEYEQAIRSSGASQTNVNLPGQPNIGTIPAGYQAVQSPDGNWTMAPIPGSPAATEAEAAASQAEMREDQAGRQANVVVEDLQRAISMMNWQTTGAVGSVFQGIPGLPASDLSALLQTVKANIGFDKLQAMREASPTGGALGAVSDFENRQLQSVFGNLEQSQSEAQLRTNARRALGMYLDIVHGPGNWDEATGMPREAAQDPPAQSPAAQSQIVSVTSEAEFAALPSGTTFRAPDGSIRVKP